MDFRTLLSATLLALASVLPGLAAAQQAAPTFGLDPFKVKMFGLDPARFVRLPKLITPTDLEKLGYASFEDARQRALVEIAHSDCPKTCHEDIGRTENTGLCLCPPTGDGACPPGASPAKQAGKPICTALPGYLTIFASDGGLGTTRVRLTP